MNTLINLEEIEKAIMVNCVINHHANHRLVLYRNAGPVKNTYIPRMIFIYLAEKAGFEPKDARDYIGMTKEEYEGIHKKLPRFYEHGKIFFEDRPQYFDEIPLFFYRKLRLISNYIFRVYGVDLY